MIGTNDNTNMAEKITAGKCLLLMPFFPLNYLPEWFRLISVNHSLSMSVIPSIVVGLIFGKSPYPSLQCR